MSSSSSTTTTTLGHPNIAITTNPSHELSIVQVPTPSPAAGECLIHVTATGICGSDVHFWKHGGIGSSKITCELGLGHESAGEIVGLGEGVEGWKIGTFCETISSLFAGFDLEAGPMGEVAQKCSGLSKAGRTEHPRLLLLLFSCYFLPPGKKDALCYSIYRTRRLRTSETTANDTLWLLGDRVALENGIPCSKPSCTACRTGQYHGCPDMVFFSSPPVHGTLRRYHAHPAAWLHRLPDSMTFEEGALLEPLSVALAGIERAGLRLGDPLVICGAGPIGLVSLLAAHAAGAAPLVITDLDENRLEMAKRLVPRVRTVKVASGVGPEGVAEDIKKALGQEAGLVLECTGVESSIHSAIYVRRSAGGRLG